MEIKFVYNDVVENAAPALDLVPQHADEDNLQLLEIPQRPDLETIRKHELTHAEYAPWCEHCVAARGRGELHRIEVSARMIGTSLITRIGHMPDFQRTRTTSRMQQQLA